MNGVGEAYDTLKELGDLIDDNVDAIEALEIIAADKANRSDIPTKVSELTNDSGYLTSYTETDPTVPAWAKAASKPSYSKSEVGLGNVDNVRQYSASNPPPYPVTSVNGKTGAVTIAVPQDTVRYVAQTLTEAQKAQARKNLGLNSNAIADGSITPEKTSFIVCEGTGETESTMVPNFTNLADTTSDEWLSGYRFSSSNGGTPKTTTDGGFVTNFFPLKPGDVIRVKGVKGGANTYFQLVPYDSAGEQLTTAGFFFERTKEQAAGGIKNDCTVSDGVTEWTAFIIDGKQHSYTPTAVNARFCGIPVTVEEDVIITVNEPITYTEVTSGSKTYTLDKKITVPRANGLKSGARWFALGDSITEGYVSTVDSSASSGYKQYLNTNESERWVNIVAEKNGYELTNYGVGGTGYAHSSNNVRKQVATIDFSKCDFVTLAYGVNDWKGKATLGSMDDDVDTVDAFVPNMRYAIKKILTDNPYCKIFVITPLNCRSLGYYDTNWGIGYTNTDNASGPGLEDIFQLEKTVCEYHGIELIDMTHCSIINRENIKTMLPDYVHPTVQCHAVMARELAKKIAFL